MLLYRRYSINVFFLFPPNPINVMKLYFKKITNPFVYSTNIYSSAFIPRLIPLRSFIYICLSVLLLAIPSLIHTLVHSDID